MSVLLNIAILVSDCISFLVSLLDPEYTSWALSRHLLGLHIAIQAECLHRNWEYALTLRSAVKPIQSKSSLMGYTPMQLSPYFV